MFREILKATYDYRNDDTLRILGYAPHLELMDDA